METEKQTCGWFVFNSGQVLIEKKEDGYHIPYGPEPPVEVHAILHLSVRYFLHLGFG